MTEITPARLSEMRGVAEAATQGEWRATEAREWGDDEKLQSAVMVSEGETLTWDDHGGEVFHPADASHIATFDPSTVLALLDALEAKTAEVDAKADYVSDLEERVRQRDNHVIPVLHARIKEAERERDAALAEVSKIEGRAVEWSKRAEKAEAALERVKALHYDAGESQGYTPEVRGGYGMIPHCCASCGSFGEYGTPWPCETIQAIEGTEG